jgi:transcriptional regulator with XRE-family HTH domain
LRTLRQAVSLTQEQAAAAIGISFKYYQKMEAGGIEGVRLNTIHQIAHAYGMGIAELFGNVLPGKTPGRPVFAPPHRGPRKN